MPADGAAGQLLSAPMSASEVRNFGANVRFTPQCAVAPKDESELLKILNDNRHGQVRVMGSKHAWSPAIETSGVLVDMRQFDGVRIFESRGETFVAIGAGCRIRSLLKVLNERGLTTPSVGLITQQTIAGA